MQSMVPCGSLGGTSRRQASIFQSAEWEEEGPVSLTPPGEQLAGSSSPQAWVSPDTRGVRMCLESILMPHSGGYQQGLQSLGLTTAETPVSGAPWRPGHRQDRLQNPWAASLPPRHPLLQRHLPLAVPHTHLVPHAISSQLPPRLRKGLPLGGSGAGFVGPEPLAVLRWVTWKLKEGAHFPICPAETRGRCPKETRQGAHRSRPHDGTQALQQPLLPAIPARRASSFKYAVATSTTSGEMDLVNEGGMAPPHLSHMCRSSPCWWLRARPEGTLLASGQWGPARMLLSQRVLVGMLG